MFSRNYDKTKINILWEFPDFLYQMLWKPIQQSFVAPHLEKILYKY